MENSSVSKGVFAYKGKYKLGKRKQSQFVSKYESSEWYKAYKEAWSVIEQSADQVNEKTFKQILQDLYDFVDRTKGDRKINAIPTATLLTGVNLQDTDKLLENFTSQINVITPYTAILSSRDCNNLKTIMEVTVSHLLSCEDDEKNQKFKTLHDLALWYEENEQLLKKIPFVIIIPEFESVDSSVLSDFISALSCYADRINFALIFGVATSIRAVHGAFTYNIVSKLQIEVFKIPKQSDLLNDIIEGTMLSAETSFKLIGRVVKLLADNFQFNELSENGYLQGYKICTINWFFNKNAKVLCIKSENYRKKIEMLSPEEIAGIKKFPSINQKLQEMEQKKKKKISAKEFEDLLESMVVGFHNYLDMFIVALKCLHALTENTSNFLGNKLRDIYELAVSENLIEYNEYRQALKVTKMLSKEEMLKKLNKMITILEGVSESVPTDTMLQLKKFVNIIEKANLEIDFEKGDNFAPINLKNRSQFAQALKANSELDHSEYTLNLAELIEFLHTQIFSVYLKNPRKVPAYEIFTFGSTKTVKSHIVGPMKGAINKAAMDPHSYLKCSCCKTTTESMIESSMFDVCIVFKLQTECPKLINMYDWLQSFLSIVTDDHDEKREVAPKLRARFTQAVADLEHLGFIKISKKKVDHVKRLMLI